MKHLPLIIVALTLASCTKDLELDYRDLDPIPVIEANLTDKGLSVRLTLTSPMDEPMDTVAQTDYIASLTELPDDNYRLDIDFRGQHFYSECQMQSDAEILDVKFQWTKMPYDHVAVMTLFLRDNPAKSDEAWWVRIWRNGEIYKWLCFNDKYAIDGVVEASVMTTRQNPEPDDKDTLTDGDNLLITVTTVPPHVLTYLNNLAAHTIDGPTTFLDDRCLGYFLASTPTDTTLIYHPGDF